MQCKMGKGIFQYFSLGKRVGSLGLEITNTMNECDWNLG